MYLQDPRMMAQGGVSSGKVPVKLTSVNFESLAGFSRPSFPPDDQQQQQQYQEEQQQQKQQQQPPPPQQQQQQQQQQPSQQEQEQQQQQHQQHRSGGGAALASYGKDVADSWNRGQKHVGGEEIRSRSRDSSGTCLRWLY